MLPTASQLAPFQSRYQCEGAIVELDHLLIQRYAAKTLEYLAQTRSIAGISGLHLSKMRGQCTVHRARISFDGPILSRRSTVQA